MHSSEPLVFPGDVTWRAPDEYREAKARQAKPRQQQRVQHDERVCRIVERRRRQP